MRLGIILLLLAALVWAAALDARLVPSATLVVDLDGQEPRLALEYQTALTLYRYPGMTPLRQLRLLPEAAAGFPRVSADGRTWRIALRRGLRFNTGEKVTAASFTRAFDRLPRLVPTDVSDDYLGGITAVNARNPNVLVIQTNRALPDLPARLTTPLLAAVSEVAASDPRDDRRPLPSAGPYAMARYSSKEIVLIRNRFYRGDRPRRAPRLRFVLVTYDARERIERAEQGKSHLVPVPTRVAHDLAQRYGINTGRFRIDRAPEVHYLILNDRTPLLRGNEPLRRAINLALDRRTLVPTFVSGVATDQLTPAGTLGFRDLKIYPLGRPDLRRARQLAQGNGRGGQVDFLLTGCLPHGGLGGSVKSSLASIGLNVTLWLRIGRPPRDPLNSSFEIECGKVQLAYPDPAAALNQEIAEERLLDSRPDWLARLDRTARTSGRARAAAYERLERDLLRGRRRSLRTFRSSRSSCSQRAWAVTAATRSTVRSTGLSA